MSFVASSVAFLPISVRIFFLHPSFGIKDFLLLLKGGDAVLPGFLVVDLGADLVLSRASSRLR